MGRANNTSRSLQIISRLQGWDPCKIDGEDFKLLEYDENERMQGFKPGPLPGSPQSRESNLGPPGPDTRGERHYTGSKGDPEAGK